MADIIIEKIFYQPIFSWGGKIPSDVNSIRANYLKAIKEADKGLRVSKRLAQIENYGAVSFTKSIINSNIGIGALIKFNP